MEVTPGKLVAACAALFAGIVAINFVQQYRSNEALRDRLSSLNLENLRPRLLKQEGLPTEEPPDFSEILQQEQDNEPLLREE